MLRPDGRRTRAASLLLAAAVAGCGWPEQIETTIAGARAPGGAAEVVLPTTRCGDFFLIDALVDGRGPFRLLLDTGYPRTQLSPATAASLGVRRSVGSIEAGGLRAAGAPRRARRPEVPVGFGGADLRSEREGEHQPRTRR